MSGSETSSNESFTTYKKEDLDSSESMNVFNFVRSQLPLQSDFEKFHESYAREIQTIEMQDRVLKTLLSQTARNTLVNQDPCTMPDELREELMRQKRKDDAFKTALCDSFRRNQTCSYGEQCRFAHGVHELRLPQHPRGRNHPKYKTVLCDKFSTTGVCKYGTRCQFIHKVLNPMYLTQATEMLDTSSAAVNQSLYMPSASSDLSLDFNQSLPYRPSDVARAFARANQLGATVYENPNRMTFENQLNRSYLH